MLRAIGKYGLPLIRSPNTFGSTTEAGIHSRVTRLFFTRTGQLRSLPLNNDSRSRIMQQKPTHFASLTPSGHGSPSFSTKVIACHGKPSSIQYCKIPERSDGELEVPQNISDIEMKKLLVDLVKNEKKKDLIRFLNAFHDSAKFPAFKDRFWEIVIRDELIKKGDLKLIKELFPLFRNAEEIFDDARVFKPAIHAGHLELVKALIQVGMKPCSTKGVEDDALRQSIFVKRHAITRYLITEGGYDINGIYPTSPPYLSAEEHFTPAYLAVLINDPVCLRMLIELGADLEMSIRPPVGVYKSSTSLNEGDTPLICAVGQGHEECFNILMGQKVNLNHRGLWGQTALLLACTNQQNSMAEALINGKVEVNACNMFGYTALDIVEATLNQPLKEALLKAGAKSGKKLL